MAHRQILIDASVTDKRKYCIFTAVLKKLSYKTTLLYLVFSIDFFIYDKQLQLVYSVIDL